MILLGATLSLPLWASCSAASGAADSFSGGGGSFAGSGGSSPSDAGPERTDVDVPLPDSGIDQDADAGPSSLCGTGTCSPDDTTPCLPPVSEAGAGAGSDGGETDGSGGETDGSGGETDGSGGAAGAGAGGSGADGSGGAAGDDGGTDAGARIYGCRVVASERIVTRECGLAGQGRFYDSCLTSAHCAPGFACVGQPNGGVCRPYCCGGAGACPDDHFCVERQLVDPQGGEVASVRVPVCELPQQCDLSQPYPCPPELEAISQCTCKDDLACMLVKADGTSCVEPGTGLAGDSCPCAWGHVCSQGTQKCLKICSTSNIDPQCGSGRCTAFNGVPAGFGVCAGLASDGG